jgi:hypothetical protein
MVNQYAAPIVDDRRRIIFYAAGLAFQAWRCSY